MRHVLLEIFVKPKDTRNFFTFSRHRMLLFREALSETLHEMINLKSKRIEEVLPRVFLKFHISQCCF